AVFVLVDSRHDPQRIDLEFIQWLGEEGVPFNVILTKTDKLGKNQIESNLAGYKKKLEETWEELPPFFTTSSEARVGQDEILEFIANVNASINH
ncbi:MAG: YihA family ribosome biogenesis GTP-binding protein, partial [Bacteroidota bacterium]